MPKVPPETIKEARRRVYEMRKANLDWPAISEIMGKREPTCRDYYMKALAIDGLPALDLPNASLMEVRDPMALGDFLAATAQQSAEAPTQEPNSPVNDKYAVLRAAATECGMNPKAVGAMIKRMQTRYGPVLDEAKRLSTKQLIDALDGKIAMTLEFIDEHALARAELKDLNVALDIQIRNRQLLSGMPTANLDFTARLKINELLPALMKEAGRRGLTFDNPPQLAFEPSPEMPLIDITAPAAVVEQEVI